MLGIITALTPIITKLMDTQVPATAQTVKSFATSKSNLGGMAAITYGLSVVTGDPTNLIGHLYLSLGILAVVVKDAIVKIYGKNDDSSNE